MKKVVNTLPQELKTLLIYPYLRQSFVFLITELSIMLFVINYPILAGCRSYLFYIRIQVLLQFFYKIQIM